MRDGSKHEVVQSSVIDIVYSMTLFAGGHSRRTGGGGKKR